MTVGLLLKCNGRSQGGDLIHPRDIVRRGFNGFNPVLLEGYNTLAAVKCIIASKWSVVLNSLNEFRSCHAIHIESVAREGDLKHLIHPFLWKEESERNITILYSTNQVTTNNPVEFHVMSCPRVGPSISTFFFMPVPATFSISLTSFLPPLW